MGHSRDIRIRIKSVKKTAQITRAMQLVAASKMRRAQDQALRGRPYAELMAKGLAVLSPRVRSFQHTFLVKRTVEHRGVLLISSDKGLCGSLNSILFRRAVDIEPSARFVAIGRKGAQFLKGSKHELLAEFRVGDQGTFVAIRPVVEFLIKAFEQGRIDTVEVLYPHFINTLMQKPVLTPLLPLDGLKAFLEASASSSDRQPAAEDDREMLFEPSPERILDELLPLYIKMHIFQSVLEAKASEHSARMVAMKSATDNANELIDTLTLDYNKMRQAAITQEILEISSAGLTV